MQSMLESAVKFQLRVLDERIHTLHAQSVDVPLLRRLLEICMRLAPQIIPPGGDIFAHPVLNHPDLALQNLIVAPEGTPEIRAAIDWQNTTISPFLTQCRMPPAFTYEEGLVPMYLGFGLDAGYPDGFENMTPEEQEFVELHRRIANRHISYYAHIHLNDRLRSRAGILISIYPIADIVPIISRCVEDGPQDLIEILLKLQEEWQGEWKTNCPIDFTEEERAAFVVAQKKQEAYAANTKMVFRTLECTPDGLVDAEQYEDAVCRMIMLREDWDESKMGGPFPLYEGSRSYALAQ